MRVALVGNRPTRLTIRLAGVLALAIVLFACVHLPARAQDEGSIWLPTVLQGGALAEVTSPDGLILLRLSLSDARNFTGVPRFDVTYRSGEGEAATISSIISGGRLGLDLKSVTESASGEEVAAALVGTGANWRWQNATVRSVRTQYAMPFAERAVIPDAYTELTVDLTSIGVAPEVRLQLIVRVYNEGIALRYRLPQQTAIGTARIDGEATTFAFSGNYKVWAQSSEGEHPHENEHLPATITTAPSPMENPLTIQHADGFYMALTEAAVENYSAARFVRSASSPPSLRVEMRGSAQSTLPFASPWRVLMIAPTAAKLVEQNYLMYNLAPPSRIANTSWIKPGTAMRVGDVKNVAYAKEVINFAAERGIQYIIFDAGWYSPKEDEDNPVYSPTMPFMGEVEMQDVVQYANDRGIGVILYINFRQLQRELDSIMTRYRYVWGVSGLKLGFVDGTSQAGIKEILYTVQKSAQYGMFVDIHDKYCPSGMNRTWPNLLTQECVRGNEKFPGAEHNATLPFTRNLLGPADYTIPYYDLDPKTREPRNLLNTSRAHQLALSVIYFSPLTFLFWYDTPYDYNGEPEVAFFHDLPTHWDETRVLNDAIGDQVTIARRSGDQWFVGSITDGTSRTVELALDFLPAGKTYTAHVYSDGGATASGGGTTVDITTETVTNANVLTLEIPADGGNAIRLEPTP